MPEESQNNGLYGNGYLEFLDEPGELDDELSDASPVEFSQFEDKAFRRWAAAHDVMLNQLLKVFTKQHQTEHQLRERYASRFLFLFIGEAGIAFIILGLFGRGVLRFPNWMATAFFTGVFAHTTYLIQKIISYLFEERSDKLLELFINRFFSSYPGVNHRQK